MISVRNISKTYQKHGVLDAVSFTIDTGENVAFVGQSGSGKTTLLRIIAGLEIADGGEITINDVLVASSKVQLPPYQRGIGLVMQSPALWSHLTVQQHLAFGLRKLSTTERQQRIEATAQLCRIDHILARYPDKLSGGEARRVSLARTLAPQPTVLLLDEPFVHLDPALKEALQDDLITILKKTTMTVLLVSHDPLDAEKLCSRIIRLEKGRVW